MEFWISNFETTKMNGTSFDDDPHNTFFPWARGCHRSVASLLSGFKNMVCFASTPKKYKKTVKQHQKSSTGKNHQHQKKTTKLTKIGKKAKVIKHHQNLMRLTYPAWDFYPHREAVLVCEGRGTGSGLIAGVHGPGFVWGSDWTNAAAGNLTLSSMCIYIYTHDMVYNCETCVYIYIYVLCILVLTI